ncbi:hypothetical protein ACOME3_008914 [Neoechinorhynchus agilis]
MEKIHLYRDALVAASNQATFFTKNMDADSKKNQLSKLVNSALLKMGDQWWQRTNSTRGMLFRQGIQNDSTYCYANSAFQSLLACDSFSRLMSDLQRNCPALLICDGNETDFPAVQLFATLANMAVNNETVDDRYPLNLRFLQTVAKSLISQRSRSTDGQEDVHELLTVILASLDSEIETCINAIPKSKYLNEPDIDEDGFILVEPRKHKSIAADTFPNPIRKIFQGKIKYDIYNSDTDELVSSNTDTFYTLSVSPNEETLVDSLLKYCRKTRIDGLDFPSYQTAEFTHLPECLILHLKCFKFESHKNGNTRVKKLFNRIKFPLNLRIPNKCLYKLTPSVVSYRLFAVIHHTGTDTNHGHFYVNAYAKDVREWLRFDDGKVTTEMVRDVHVPKVGRTVPFILFYEAVEQNRSTSFSVAASAAATVRNGRDSGRRQR